MDALNDEQKEELRGDLTAAREELARSIESAADGARPVALDQPIGRLSRMDAMQQQSMAKANRLAAKQRLGRVEVALERFGRGDYGVCIECEEPIGYPRLKAKPEAALCIACQNRQEQGA